MAVSAEILVTFDMAQTAGFFGDDDGAADTNYFLRYSLADGTSADQFDELFTGKVDMTASTNQDDDLTALSDIYGTTLTAAEMVGFLIVNEDPAMTNSILTVGAAASNPWIGWCGGADTAITNIGPNGFVLMMNPGAAGLGTVTNSSADVLRIACGSGAGAEVRRMYLMRSA